MDLMSHIFRIGLAVTVEIAPVYRSAAWITLDASSVRWIHIPSAEETTG